MNEALIERAERAGYGALVVTVDGRSPNLDRHARLDFDPSDQNQAIRLMRNLLGPESPVRLSWEEALNTPVSPICIGPTSTGSDRGRTCRSS